MSMNENHDIQLVIITGMSGAGKPSPFKALRISVIFALTICRLPSLPKFLELMKESSSKMSKVALVMDLRGREFLTG